MRGVHAEWSITTQLFPTDIIRGHKVLFSLVLCEDFKWLWQAPLHWITHMPSCNSQTSHTEHTNALLFAPPFNLPVTLLGTVALFLFFFLHDDTKHRLDILPNDHQCACVSGRKRSEALFFWRNCYAALIFRSLELTHLPLNHPLINRCKSAGFKPQVYAIFL